MPKRRTARVDVQGDPSAANPLAAVSMNAVLSGDRFREAAETAEAGFSYVAEKVLPYSCLSTRRLAFASAITWTRDRPVFSAKYAYAVLMRLL